MRRGTDLREAALAALSSVEEFMYADWSALISYLCSSP